MGYSGGHLGERLYQDAVQRELKLKHMQAQQEESLRHAEEQEATFHPTILASQRRCQAVGRSLQDPNGERTKKKIHTMRLLKEKQALTGCTFKPEIDQNSEALMSQRLARMKITGPLH